MTKHCPASAIASSVFRRSWLAPGLAVCVSLAASLPAYGQQRRVAAPVASEPAVSFRPFFLAAGEQFAASKTFEAAFAQSSGPFWGGGLQIAFRPGLFVELSLSRFSKTGQRVFVTNGEAFPLGIPLTARVTPFEIAAGGRFRVAPRVTPYAGGGLGRYGYTETSEFSETAENVSASHLGFLVFGGAEVRVQRWLAVGVEAQLTRISGVLGEAGISRGFGETDLGGTAVRLKVLVGR